VTVSLLPPRRLVAGAVEVAPLAIPGAAIIALVIILAESHGGFASSVWYPAALTALALLAVLLLLAPPHRHERSRRIELALGAYAAFCAFSYLSALWADVPGQAWDAANRDLLYGIVLAIVAARPWPRAAARAALLLAVGAVVGVAVAVLVSSTHGDPARLFLEGRLSQPFGYSNATADFWLIGLWPALWLACDPDLGRLLRGLALGGAGLLMEIALLSQSRGAVLAFGVVAVLFVAFTPRRGPALIALGACAIATAVSFSTLTAVRNAKAAGDIGPAMTDARRAMVISVIALLGVGLALALLDRFVLIPTLRRRPSLARLGNLVLAGGAGVAVITALVIIGNPSTWAQARYRDFKNSGYTKVENGTTRFTGSLGSNRYDFYRVAVDEFSSHPIGGIGAENFAVQYLQHRRSDETPTYPHSFAFGTLAGVGLIGSLLFVAFLGLALSSVVARTRRAGVATKGLIVASVTGFGLFFIHGLGDWLWQFPALGILAFALLGLAMRTQDRPLAEAIGAGADPRGESGPGDRDHTEAAPWPQSPGGPRWQTIARRGAVAVVALAVAASFALPGIGARLTDSAYNVSAGDPELAIHRLSRAEGLNFLRADAPLAEGFIAQAIGQERQAGNDFRRALAREPDNWFAFFLLGILEGNLGHRSQALADIGHALSLNPGQPVVREVQTQVAAGQKVDPGTVSAQLSAQLAARLKPTG